MRNVTLTTDFGHADIYAGRFKGRLVSAVEGINLIDITHEIPPYNIITGGFSVKYTYDSYPKGTYHIVRVYEQGITKEGLLIAFSDGHFFMAPDNGVLPMALNNKFEWIRKVDFDRIDDTLNSDEIYAEVLKSMIGNAYESISKPATDYKVNSQWAVIKEENVVRGIVVIVDYFGNLITNIHFSDLGRYFNKFSRYTIHYREREELDRIVEDYKDVAEGERMCRVNDLGFLEIAMNKGPASKLLGIKFGQPVYIKFYDSQDS